MEKNNADTVLFKVAAFGLLAGLLAAWLIAAGFSGAAGAPSDDTGDVIWADVDEASLRPQGERLITPRQYRLVAANVDALKMQLAQAPPEFSQAAQRAETIVALPLPEGGPGRFRVIESPIMAPELAAKFPDMKSYIVQGVDDPTASGRLDQTPHGFHAMIFSLGGTFFIDPYSREESNLYISYFKRDFSRPLSSPLFGDTVLESNPEQVGSATTGLPVGPQLRTYRLAVAATGEYTNFHGGTKADSMAAIVTAVNRVNAIYERDAAVRLILVANNDLIVYTNGAGDPYSNSNGIAMMSQNQNNLDQVIGSANYDIGHVFSTGGGGVVIFAGVVCQASVKAQAVTGLSSPINDPFYVDYVAHEIGHQFGATHTFNGNAGACSGSQYTAATAYEPGSGTTIMGYAGICGNQNIQLNSDDHFHSASYDQIVAYTTGGPGNSCAAIVNTGNAAPVVDAGNGYTIPKETAFVLTGSASDANGEALTYAWEQYDLGPTGHPNSPSGTAPLFRSFSPTLSPSRTFPQFADLVNNTQTIGELLPSTSRSLTFRLTVRDNRAGSGGVAHGTVTHSVTAEAGPFRVTAPNTAVSWTAGAPATVTWDVANTNVAPIHCTAVDILLSLDGGYSYPHVLAANTANDGAETITVPQTSYSAAARVKIACANNIFFDISNTNFTLVNDLVLNRWLYLPVTIKGE